MKKTYLKSFCARCLTLLVLALMSTNLAWGETWTYTVTKESSPILNSDNPATVNKATWSIVMGDKVGTPSTNGDPTNSYSSCGWKWGNSKSAYWKSYTLSTDYFKDKKVKSVTVNFMNNAEKQGTMTVIQGSTTIGTASATFGTTWTDLTANTTAGTGGTLSIQYTVDQASYIHSITVEYEEATTPTVAYTVTFDAGENGTCSTPSLTEASAGAGVSLPACTANDGYVFKGWSTTESGTTPDAGEAGKTYKPSSNCTLYAVYAQLFAVKIETPENGTLLVQTGGVAVTEDTQFADGTVFDIVATPNDGYKFRNWQAVDATTHTFTASSIGTYTIKGHSVTFKANFDIIPQYTINYMVNGVNTNAQENVYEGTDLVFPDVSNIGDKEFVGWAEETINGTTDTKPSLVTTTGLTAESDKTYYAVFAQKAGNDFYKLVTSLTENNKYLFVSSNGAGGAYALDASQIGTDSNASSSAKDVTISLDGSDKVITEIDTDLEFKYNSSGNIDIVCSDSGEKLVINGSGFRKATSNYKAYWDNEKGLYGTNSNGTTNYYVSYNPSNKAFTATSGASSRVYAYEKSEASYSGYCTTILKTQDVTISSVGYATAYIPFAATISNEANDVKAYYVTVSDDKAKLNEITGTIPAETGVVLNGTGKVTFTESKETPASVDGNLLIGTTKAGGENFEETDYTYYILSNGENGVGFYWDGEYYPEFEGMGAHCAQYKAVLAVPGTTPAKCFLFDFDEPSGINNVNATSENGSIYNLQGVRVSSMTRGNVYIQNGKKFMFNK